MRILGVDPGQSGGLAIVSDGKLTSGIRMPVVEMRGKKQLDARKVVDWWLEGDHLYFDVAVIEAVHAMPKQGVSSSFQFGRMFGGIEALVMSTGVPVHYVTPSVWKKAMGLSSSKQASIDAAKVRFGATADLLLQRSSDDGIAEAALIAAFWAHH